MDAFFEDISANNVPTPPTQTTGPQPAQTTGPNNEFEELLSRSTQKLYPGCDMTTLEFTSEISHIKVLPKLSDVGFNKILALLQKACPPSKGYNFPSSYDEIKKTYKKIELGYESIHACINDCFLFWGSDDNLKMPNCLVCKASRWKDEDKGEESCKQGGVAAALVERDASRGRDGDNSHAKVERYVGGLPDMIHGSVKASKPQSMQEAIEFATEMMDKKMITAAERQAENKKPTTTIQKKQCGTGLHYWSWR
ncbi:hypothetical protein Tco_0698705 [Tanacetum coccineum]